MVDIRGCFWNNILSETKPKIYLDQFIIQRNPNIQSAHGFFGKRFLPNKRIRRALSRKKIANE